MLNKNILFNFGVENNYERCSLGVEKSFMKGVLLMFRKTIWKVFSWFENWMAFSRCYNKNAPEFL